MYKTPKHSPTSLKRNDSYVAERIELKIKRILANKEPIQNALQLIYTSSDDGVKPEYDIRTDKWEIAVEQMDKVQQMQTAKKKKDKETPVIDINQNTSDGQQQPNSK